MTEELTTMEPANPIEPPDLTLRLYSAINRVLFSIRKIRKISRSHYKETAAWELHHLSNPIQLRIEELRQKYAIRFENTLNRGNALENYHLLDILDQLSLRWQWQPQHKTQIDVGCKNFYYASCLSAFFKPQTLTGIELDAYGFYADCHTRFSYAQYYISELPHTHYLAGDFCQHSEQTELLTFFYPFVIPEPLVRWDLPLSEFKPETIFAQAFKVLKDTGSMLRSIRAMMNTKQQKVFLLQPALSKCTPAIFRRLC